MLLLEGSCQEFYNLKNTIKNHLTLAGGQLHFEALQYQQELNKRKKRGKTVTENLVAVALTVVKTKAAALHFETMVSAHDFTGSDICEFGHGRKQLSDILRCANTWINEETAKFLALPLPSTNLPPHFYVASDKSTPHRITNHAIMLCSMIEGKRCAVPVNAPDVYRLVESGADGEVAGADADQLAHSLYKELQNSYPTLSKDLINGSFQGTVCDGAYQATDFEETLEKLCGQESAGEFFTVLWDPPHYIDLALKDVFEGKTGSSNEFFQRLVKRTSIVHQMFQRDKMLSHAKEMARNDDDLLLRLTSRSCSTRFSASQYVEFRKLIDSLPLYIKTFRAFKCNEVKEYQIAGIDFLLDLCSACDILKPFIELSVSLQGLSVPCWKAGIWWERLRNHMKSIQEEFSFDNIPSHFQLLEEFYENIVTGVYKNTGLVDGWLLMATETKKVGRKETEVIEKWRVRDPSDVEDDVKVFLADLLSSFEARMLKCSKQIVDILTCLDIDSIVGFLCGERLESGSIKLQCGEGALELYGLKNFEKFFQYVCSLPHIKRLNESRDDEVLLFDPALAATVFRKFKMALRRFLWQEDGYHLSAWLNLPQEKGYECLQKMEIVTDDHGTFSFANCYAVTVKNVQKPYITTLNEEEVYRSIYTNPQLYGDIGLEGCICVDIALAKGGTESIVESYYSVMDSQKMSGGQNNETLGLRTKVDWSLPGCANAHRAIEEIAELYLTGDKERKLPKHSAPILGDRAKYKREGKVMKRHRKDTRLPYLL